MTTKTSTRKPAAATKIAPRPETKPAKKATPAKATADRILKVAAEQGVAAGQAAFLAEATAILTGTTSAATLAKVTGSRKATVTVVEPDGTVSSTQTVTRKAKVAPAPVLDIATMDSAKRIAAAKQENDQVKAQMSAKNLTRCEARKQVATPVLDWMEQNPAAGRKAPAKGSTVSSRSIVVEGAQLTVIGKLIQSMRKDGASWKAIAAATATTETPLTENQVYIVAGRNGWRTAAK